MKRVSGLEQMAPKLTMLLSLSCIIGLFSLMTLPDAYQLNRLVTPGAMPIIGHGQDVILFKDWPSSSAKQPSPAKVQLNAQAARPSAASVEHVSHYQFSQSDLQRYQRIYAQQAKGNWSNANHDIAKLQDRSLYIDMLAQRYLHPNYESSVAELTQWLKAGAAHPDAARIRQLALRKGASSSHLPQPALHATPSLRYGLHDGMAGKSMPRGWHSALNMWQAQKYAQAYAHFASMAKRSGLNKWQQSTAHYWAYRAGLHSGQHNMAKYHLQQAAMHPFTLYGAMAGTQLAPSQYKPRFANVSQAISAQPATKRAAAFIALDEPEKAKRELLHLYAQLPAAHKGEMISLAAAFKLPALQLYFSQAQRKTRHAADATAYPVASWLPSYDMQTDPALVYAIIRQESAFNTQARSHAGATGAMQLLPSTANYMVENQHLAQLKLASIDMSTYTKPLSVKSLQEPALNMLIGQHYIQYLSAKPYIQGNLVYLLAAYNAGPSNLLAWQKRFSNIHDPLLFIEKIPFKETRHYIKQVMANYLVYQAMLYGTAHSVPALQAGTWPKLPTRNNYASAKQRRYAAKAN